MWGPNTNSAAAELRIDGVPYAPFSKGDKLGKVADWAADPAKEAKEHKRAQGRGFRDPYHAYGAGASSFFNADDNDNQINFSVVDSVRSGPVFGAKHGSKPTVLRARGRVPGGGAGTGAVSGGTAAAQAAVAQQTASAQAQTAAAQRQPLNRGPRTMTIGSATLHNRRGGGRPNHWGGDKARARKPSVAIGADWTRVQTNNISELAKLSFETPASETLGEYGYVQMFDKRMERLTQSRRLERVDVTDYNVSTSEDPVIQQYAKENEVGVFATDAILALLMCAPKSNNPWDIVVNKEGGRVFFDKRDSSALDFPSVDENAQNPPLEVSDSKIDNASALSIEASYVNLNFDANVVVPGEASRVTLAHPNPFSNGDEPSNAPLLPKGYIYKKFELGTEEKPFPLFVRTETDAAVERNGKRELATVFALNEYGGVSKTLKWKDQFASQQGAIVTAEMKNNLNKLSQWTARSLLAGVHTMKIGFVSRINPRENQAHEIVAVLSRQPSHFAQQLTFNLNNAWGIIKSLADLFAALEDGKYVLLRDPVMPSVSIYRLPPGTELN